MKIPMVVKGGKGWREREVKIKLGRDRLSHRIFTLGDGSALQCIGDGRKEGEKKHERGGGENRPTSGSESEIRR